MFLTSQVGGYSLGIDSETDGKSTEEAIGAGEPDGVVIPRSYSKVSAFGNRSEVYKDDPNEYCKTKQSEFFSNHECPKCENAEDALTFAEKRALPITTVFKFGHLYVSSGVKVQDQKNIACKMAFKETRIWKCNTKQKWCSPDEETRSGTVFFSPAKKGGHFFGCKQIPTEKCNVGTPGYERFVQNHWCKNCETIPDAKLFAEQRFGRDSKLMSFLVFGKIEDERFYPREFNTKCNQWNEDIPTKNQWICYKKKNGPYCKLQTHLNTMDFEMCTGTWTIRPRDD